MMTIGFVVFVLAIVTIFVILNKKLRLTHRQWFWIFITSIILTGASTLIHWSKYGGTLIGTYYGWPHFFIMWWQSFQDTSVNSGFSFLYLAANLLFFFVVTTLVTSIFSQTKVLSTDVKTSS